MQVRPIAIRALLSVILLVAATAWADTHDADDGARAPGERPRIGLALSGGGARGAAHIGVLQVLEDNRIPIDYIAGTSMGAIVGGLYATGMSPEEIKGAIDSIDWKHVFDDPTPREERSFRRKRDDDLYLVKSRPGIDKDGLKLPAGVVQGQKIDLALTRLTLDTSHLDDFDDFRIPFRAVATDIVTGDAVVLESGSLTHAIRASMSVPAVFSPAIIDGRMLVDGGVANNLPIDVVRDLGADIVIAVDISTPLLTEEEVDSVLSITVQLTGILTRRNTVAQIDTLTDDDVLLIPDLGDITSADFERALEAVPTGRAAAQAQIEGLRRLALPTEEYASYRAGLTIDKTTLKEVDFIRVDNQSRIKDSVISSRIYNSKVGEPLSIAAVERDVGRIYGLEIFENVGYTVLEEDGDTGLEFRAKERSWGPTYLQFGASYNSNNDGDNIFNLAVATLATEINPSNGELQLGVQIGEEPGILIDFHQPFGSRGMWFYDVKGTYGDRVFTVFDDDTAVSDYELTEATIEASFGRELGTWGEARMGLRYQDGDASVRIGTPIDNEDVIFQRGEFFTRFSIDELDSYFFPSRGYFTKVEWSTSREGLGSDSDYDQVFVNASYVKSWGRNRVIGIVDYQSTISGRAPIEGLILAGGFARISGFNANELSGQHYGRLSAVYYRHLADTALFPIYGGVMLEKGNVFENRDDIGFGNSLYAGSAFLGADTLIGPLYFAYGNAEGGNSAMYLFLGRAF